MAKHLTDLVTQGSVPPAPSRQPQVRVMSTEDLEREIAARQLNRKDAQAARIENQRRQYIQARRLARASEFGSSAVATTARGLLSAVLNFGETAGFGLPSSISAVVTAPITQAVRNRKIAQIMKESGRHALDENAKITLREAFELNRAQAQQALGASPVGQAVGTVGAFIAPTGPARLAVGGARLASRAGARLVGQGTAGFGQAAATAARTSLARSSVLQLAEGFTSAVGAVGAVSIAEIPGEIAGGKSTSEAVRDAITAPLTIRNLAFGTVAGGALPAAFRARPPGGEIKDAVLALVDRVRAKLPGLRVSADVLRDENGFIHGLVDTLAKSNAGRRFATKFMREAFFEPLKAGIAEIRRQIGATTLARDIEVAGQAIRRQVGAARRRVGESATASTAEVLESDIVGSAIRAEAAAKTAAAFRAGGSTPVTQRVVGTILQRMRLNEQQAERTLGTRGPRGTEMSQILTDLKGLFERHAGQITVQHLENIRQRLGAIAKFGTQQIARNGTTPQLTTRDVTEAKRLYRTLRVAESHLSPEVDRGLRAARDLHQVARDLSPLVNAGDLDNAALVSKIFHLPDFAVVFRRLEERLSRTEMEALRGSYLGSFLNQAMSVRDAQRGFGIFKEATTRRLWEGTGMFRKEVFDRILPGFRAELDDYAQISGLFQRGIGAAEGSATARRQEAFQMMEDAARAGAEIATMGTSLMTDPKLSWMMGSLFRWTGMFALSRSLLVGKVGETLNTLASYGPVNGPARAAAILDRAPESPFEREMRTRPRRAAEREFQQLPPNLEMPQQGVNP